jgi:hypothetical protein
MWFEEVNPGDGLSAEAQRHKGAEAKGLGVQFSASLRLCVSAMNTFRCPRVLFPLPKRTSPIRFLLRGKNRIVQ